MLVMVPPWIVHPFLSLNSDMKKAFGEQQRAPYLSVFGAVFVTWLHFLLVDPPPHMTRAVSDEAFARCTEE